MFKIGDLFLESENAWSEVKLIKNERNAYKLYDDGFLSNKDVTGRILDIKTKLEQFGINNVNVVQKKIVTETTYTEMESYSLIGNNEFVVRLRPKKVDEDKNA